MGMDIFLYTKTPGGFIRIQLILSMDMRELDMVKYIQSVLEVGRINTYPAINSEVQYLPNKSQEIVFPLIHHGEFFLTPFGPTLVCQRRSLRLRPRQTWPEDRASGPRNWPRLPLGRPGSDELEHNFIEQ
jgi:hypothetical protein